MPISRVLPFLTLGLFVPLALADATTAPAPQMSTTTAPVRKPQNLTLTLALVVDERDSSILNRGVYIFVLNGTLAFRKWDALCNYLKELPKGSTLTWAPPDDRAGDEPIINSKEAMKKFADLCEQSGIKLTIIPGG